MRLTGYLRDTFVRSIIDDVPTIDYDKQVDSLLLEYAVSRLPPLVRRVWDDKELRHYVAVHQYWKMMYDSAHEGLLISSTIPIPMENDM